MVDREYMVYGIQAHKDPTSYELQSILHGWWGHARDGHRILNGDSIMAPATVLI